MISEFMFYLFYRYLCYAHWWPIRFPYHMMFVTFASDTMGATSGTGAVYPSGAHEFIPCIL